jgi:DNA recombination protein RmuC
MILNFFIFGFSLTLGIIFSWFWANRKNNLQIEKQNLEILNLNKVIAEKEAKLAPLESSLNEMKLERDEQKKLIQNLTEKNADLTAKNHSLETEKQLLEQQLKTLKETIEELKTQTKLEFENLANKVLEAKTKVFSETTEKNLDNLLKPLREKIQEFEKTIEDKYTNEAKERHALKSEIEKLITLSDKMALEANSLTQALKGDSKVQGDWGELVLERILEASGLQEGEEYILQSTHKNDEGDNYKPDVIINLPDNKHIIIDSKVSLTAFERYRSAPDEKTQNEALKAHIESIKKHIDELSEKQYSKLKDLKSPEFVFMFIPIEPAYVCALKKEPGLFNDAWKKGVAIVTATTLLTSLKTVASIWRLEKQNKNAQEIAREGASLYDKFVGFLTDFEELGKIFDNGQKKYRDALNKLKDGKGNVFKKMERLKELGVKPEKQIKHDYLE